MSAAAAIGSECARLEKEVREAHAKGRSRREAVLAIRLSRNLSSDERDFLFAVLDELYGAGYVAAQAAEESLEAAKLDALSSTSGGLLDQTVAFIRRFVVIGATEADAVALWNAHSYVYECAPATPYLHAYSPEPGSGKTTLLKVLSLIVREPLKLGNTTGPTLFRLIDKKHPTLLYDEVDAVFGRKGSDSAEEIRQILNSGYGRGEPAYRCVGRDFEPTAFDVYCPKALTGLNELPATLAHRSIPIAMKPPLPTDHYEDLDVEDVEPEVEALRNRLQAWAHQADPVLRDRSLKPEKLPELDPRANEIWRILFRIADMAGGDWPARARAAALGLSGGTRSHEDKSPDVKLLSHVRDLFDGERMLCRTVVDALNADEELPYGGWSDGRGISTRELGKKLARYGIHAKTIRVGEDRSNGYERTSFFDAWNRYLPVSGPSNRDTVTTGMVEPKAAETNRDTEGLVTVSENGANPHGQRVVTVVTVSGADSGASGSLSDLERAARFDEMFPREESR